MQPTKLTITESRIVLLVILPESRMTAMAKLLDKFAMANWQTTGFIHLVPIAEQNKSNSRRILATVRQHAHKIPLSLKQTNLRIQFFDVLNELARYELQRLVYAPEFITKTSFKKLADDMLEIRLREWGLHWRQAVLGEVSHWQHDVISDQDVEDWLRQFDQISAGNKRWIGERLLRNFRVWSGDKFAEVLTAPPQIDQSPQPVCIFRYENGKSADAIALIFRKKMAHGGGDVHEFVNFLQNKTGDTCLVLEDGLFTGVEFSDLLKSLCGHAGYNKCPALPDPSRLQTCKTVIRFALGTDIGAHRVRNTLIELNINATLEICQEIKVLTATGLANLHANQLYEADEHGKDVLRAAEQDIIPHAFSNPQWGDEQQTAKAFCHDLGLALWRSYQTAKGKNWSEKRLSDCALGAGNMGMLFAFAHSLPKSTLPVFWCHGEVPAANGRIRKWLPLFKSAHRQ